MSEDRGFTIVEVLIAAALMGLILTATATTMLTAHRTLDRSGEQTMALALGTQRIEWLRTQAYTSSALTAGSSTETLTGTYVGFTRLTTVTDNTPRAGIKQVAVQTTTPSGVQVVLTTLVATP